MRKIPPLLSIAIALCLCGGETAVAQKDKRSKPPASVTPPKETTPEAAYDQGNVAFDRKEWAQAISHYNTALRLKPHWTPALVNRGRAYFFDGKFDPAIADLRKACEVSPDAAFPYTWLAGAYLDKGDHAAAIDAASQALKLDAKQALAWYFRGTAHIHQGAFAKAIDDLTEAAGLNPNDAVIYNNRGIAYQKLGEEKKAVADFTGRDQLNGKTADSGVPLTKQAAFERMKEAERQYQAIEAEVEALERVNDTLRRLRPPQYRPIPPVLLQRRAGAWNVLQEARRVYKMMP